MGFNCLKENNCLKLQQGDSLLFTITSPGVPGTHFIHLERMKG